MKYLAVYFDGKTSAPHEVEIAIVENGLSIRGLSVSVDWKWQTIALSPLTNKKKALLQYGEFPHEYLEFDVNSELYHTIEKYIPLKLNPFSSINRRFIAFLLLTLLFSGMFVCLGYFVALPKLAAYLATQIPQKQEIELGNKIFQNTIDKTKIDHQKSILLAKFADKINFHSSYPLHLTVIKENIINAYAIPGGHIVVYDAILKKIKSENQLAALLAHEASHIHKKHTLLSLSQEVSGSIFISMLWGDFGIINGLIRKANELYGLHFSRQMETEADIEGLKILEKNQINPQGMIELMQHLKAEEQKQQLTNLPSFFSTHPLPEERIKIIEQNAQSTSFEPRQDLKAIFIQLKQE